jgi:hypothetical protein
MSNYATVDDVAVLWRTLTAKEAYRAEALLPGVCDALRKEASKRGKDLDVMITTGEISLELVKNVTVGIISRTLSQSTENSNLLSQESQSAMGYTWSGTYALPGGGVLNILNNDLKRLGLLRQKYGVIDLYGHKGN